MRRRGVPVLALSALLALSGCVESDAPSEPLTPLTAAPSPSASGPPDIPAPPPEADPVTAEGASAFAEFYLDQITPSRAPIRIFWQL